MESGTSPCTIRTESWSCSGRTGSSSRDPDNHNRSVRRRPAGDLGRVPRGHWRTTDPALLKGASIRTFLRKLAGLLTRVRLPTDPIPATWPQLVDRRVPLIAHLPSADQERLYHIMQLFLKEVPFEACGGLAWRDEIPLTIAAQACLLLLNMPYPRYSRVRRVLVYPAAFMPKTQHSYRSDQLVVPDEPAAGQAWQSGVVILGWEEVKDGALATNDGRNVVFHEFAHMLDAEDGALDGIPVLDSHASYHTWVTQ